MFWHSKYHLSEKRFFWPPKTYVLNNLITIVRFKPWGKVQDFQNPELQKFKFLNLPDAYKNE